MTHEPIDQFLADLASKSPTPGGGSAAAIMGAMGAALVSMVCNLTEGKAGYETVQGEMQAMLVDAERLRQELAAMVQADVEVFDRVMRAYRLPKESDAQKQQRSEAIQSALKDATDVPLMCARLCGEVIALSRVCADKGNRNAVSDAGVAAMAAYAAQKSAALNVYINTSSIKDGAFVAERLDELDRLLADGESAAQAVFQAVKEKL